MSRDYAAEMRAVIDAEATGTYVPTVVAAHIAEKLRQTDPELLSGWLDAQAEQILRHTINLRDCSQRTAARHSRSRSVFAEDAAAAEAGEPERLAGWLSTRFTVEDGSRKPLGEMAKEELLGGPRRSPPRLRRGFPHPPAAVERRPVADLRRGGRAVPGRPEDGDPLGEGRPAAVREDARRSRAVPPLGR